MNDFMESDEDEDLTFTQRVEKKGPTLVLPVNLSATTTSKLSSTISDCCRGILAEYKSTIINWRKRALRLGDLKDHRAKGTFPTRLARAPALPQYPSTISEDRRVILRQQHESLWLNFQRSSLDMEIAAIKTDADKLRHEVEMLANTDGAWDTLREKHPDLVKQYETFFLQEFPVVFTRMLTEIQQELKIQDDPFVLPDPTPPPAPPPPPPPPAPPSPLPLPSNALTATSESNSRLDNAAAQTPRAVDPNLLQDQATQLKEDQVRGRGPHQGLPTRRTGARSRHAENADGTRPAKATTPTIET
eukprot:gene9433-10422_t